MFGLCFFQNFSSSFAPRSRSYFRIDSRARALQSLRRRCSPRGVAAAGASSRNSCLVQSLEPGEVSRLLVSRSRFAVGHFLGFAVFPRRTAPVTVKRPVHPLSEFHVPPESCPTSPSQPAGAGRHLSWASCSLQHIRKRRSTFRRPCHGPLRSARRVWLPSRRLTPSAPLPALFHAGGALGIRPSELSPRGRYPPRFRGEGPTCRSTCRYSRRRSDGPAQQAAASGFQPFRESLAIRRGLTRRPLDAPMGFALLGHAGTSLVTALAATPPTRSANRSLSAGVRRRPGVSIDSHLAPPQNTASRGTWSGQPF
jgi:hypothetical protein